MHRNNAATLFTFSLLAAAASLSFLMPDTLSVSESSAFPDPAEIRLTGIVRDFSVSHVDFDVAGGFGHIAGNIDSTLGPDGRPVFTGGGNQVVVEATDDAGNPIPSHLAGANTPPVHAYCYTIPNLAADGLVAINNSSQVDSFDSSLGPYGGANVDLFGTVGTNATGANMLRNENSSDIFGHALFGPGGDPSTVYSDSPTSTLNGELAELSQPIPIPTVTLPVGANIGDVMYNGAVAIGSDMRVDDLELRSSAAVAITADVTIIVDGDFEMNTKGGSGYARIALAPGVTLRLIVAGDIDIVGEVNYNTGLPDQCLITKVGTGSIDILSNVSRVVARIVAPESDLTLRQSAEVFGTFVGNSLNLDNNAFFHIDTAHTQTFPQAPDTPGVAGGASNGGIDSSGSFNEWFRDRPGANQSATHMITLTQGMDGVYEFSTTDFHPVNDRLLGNEGRPTNDFFTYSIDARFTYTACSGQMVEFEGDDDCWLFVDGDLVMDLGGAMPGSRQYLDVDRLGLTEGQTYQFLLLYAQRQDSSADFTLRTTLELTTDTVLRVVTSAAD